MVEMKSTSSATWWIKNPKERRTRTWGRKLCQDMTDLFRHISLHGYSKLFSRELLFYEKLIWMCVHGVIFTFMCIALTFTWDQYVLQYFAINLDDPLYPIDNIPFPAVSICSNNRISRQAAERYATELSKLDPQNRTVKHFMDRIHYFRSFYYGYERYDDFAAFTEFQQFLDHYGTKDNETYYNVSNIMRRLTPSCQDFLSMCVLGGKIIDCNVFEMRQTIYGLCCSFTINQFKERRSYSSRYVGSNMGLIVTLNTTHKDDTVSLLNMNGYVVMIHTPNNFADISSGNAIEFFPMVNEETYVAVKARSMDTEENLRTFSPAHRECYFDNEAPFPSLMKDNRYSLSTCITRCRLRSIVALCNCVPFYMPQRMRKLFPDVPICSLNYVECLQRYQFKWRNVLTKRVDIEGLEREVEEALYCPLCLPSCDDVRYTISMMSLPIDSFSLPGVEVSNLTIDIRDVSVLRLFFSEPTSIFYKRVIKNTWVQALSTVGNIVSICMGFSLVALFEIFYFLFQYLSVSIKTCITESRGTEVRRNNNNTQSRGTEVRRNNNRMDSSSLYIYP